MTTHMLLLNELEQLATSEIEREIAREVKVLIEDNISLREDVKRFREYAYNEKEVRLQLERTIELLEEEVKTLRRRCEQGYAIGRQSGREDCQTLLKKSVICVRVLSEW